MEDFSDEPIPYEQQDEYARYGAGKYTGSTGSVLSGGGRHSYDYYPQYLIKKQEEEMARLQGLAPSTAKIMQKKLKGRRVATKIKNYYIKQRHFPKARAKEIAGAVAGKEHRERIKPIVMREKRRLAVA
jgi:hypothetical protein